MAELPTCPNFERKQCERSDLVLAGEQDKFWNFICRTCHLFWVLSKPRTKAEGKYRSEVSRMEKATESDRKLAAMPKKFYAPRGGWAQ